MCRNIEGVVLTSVVLTRLDCISIIVVFMGPAINSRIRPPNAKIPVLQIEFEGKAIKYNSSID